MTELIWLNGKISPLSDARLPIEERGSQFADGVYEVIRVYQGQPFTLDEHLERLEQSAKGIRLNMPIQTSELAGQVKSLIAQSGLSDGMIYMQLTRGFAARNHLYPQNEEPLLYFYTRELAPILPAGEAPGCKLLCVSDERWKRCWVKAIALLPAVMAKNWANEAGCDEALFTEDGVASECSTTNFFAVVRGKLVTAPVGKNVLPGISRSVILQLAEELGLPVELRHPTVHEVLTCEEAFISSTTREISWVKSIEWQGAGVNGFGTSSSGSDAEIGPITLKLHRAFQARVKRSMDEGRNGRGAEVSDYRWAGQAKHEAKPCVSMPV